MKFKIVVEDNIDFLEPASQDFKFVAYEKFFLFFWSEIGDFPTLEAAQDACQRILRTCKPKKPVYYSLRCGNQLFWESTEE